MSIERFVDFAQKIAAAHEGNVVVTVVSRRRRAAKEPVWKDPRIARLEALVAAIDREMIELEFARTYAVAEIRDRIEAERRAG